MVVFFTYEIVYYLNSLLFDILLFYYILLFPILFYSIIFYLFQRLPSSYSTVSIQTEPNISCNGGTTLMNGGSTALNGGIHTISNGAISTLPRYMNGGNHLPRDLGDIEEQVQVRMHGPFYRYLVS